MDDISLQETVMFKTKKIHQRSLFMHPLVSMILIDMYWYTINHNRPFVVTSTVRTVEENERVGASHLTHVQGRAFDLSVKGWSKKFRKQFCDEFNKRYRKEAAISSSTLRPTLCVDHVGTAAHIHVQVNRDYIVKDLKLPVELI